MAYMVGADPAQLDDLAARMTAAAERLESIRAGIGATLAHSHWHGRDADDFRHLWHHQLAPRLHNAATTTRTGATTVRTNAQQQRDASGLGGSDGGGRLPGGPVPVVSPDVLATLFATKDGVERVLLALGGLGYLAGSLSDIAAGKIPFLKALAPALNALPDGVRNLLIKDLTDMRGLARGVGVAGEMAGAALNGVFLGLDVLELGHRLATDPGGAETYNTAADVLFGIAGIAAIGCPPAALIIGGAGLAYSVATMIYPDLTKDIVHGVGAAGQAAWEGIGDLVELHQQVADIAFDAAGDVAEAAGEFVQDRVADVADVAQDVVSGGFNAVKNIFSF